MNLHTDQATLDRWRTEGRWVMFGEGDRVLNPTPAGVRQRREDIEPSPPDWMTEAAKPCETCGGTTDVFCDDDDMFPDFCCDCDDGSQRHTITVPCYCAPIREAGKTWPYGDCLVPEPCTDGRITVLELAVVEWGPWLIVESWIGSRATPIPAACLSHDGFLDWRWSSDDLSLVGKYAIGGKLV